MCKFWGRGFSWVVGTLCLFKTIYVPNSPLPKFYSLFQLFFPQSQLAQKSSLISPGTNFFSPGK